MVNSCSNLQELFFFPRVFVAWNMEKRQRKKEKTEKTKKNKIMFVMLMQLLCFVVMQRQWRDKLREKNWQVNIVEHLISKTHQLFYYCQGFLKLIFLYSENFFLSSSFENKILHSSLNQFVSIQTVFYLKAKQSSSSSRFWFGWWQKKQVAAL